MVGMEAINKHAELIGQSIGPFNFLKLKPSFDITPGFYDRGLPT